MHLKRLNNDLANEGERGHTILPRRRFSSFRSRISNGDLPLLSLPKNGIIP